jgi:hypothetical protein
MSGDWIKMRVALATDPKVIAIGRFLEASKPFPRWLTSDEHSDVIVCVTALRYFVTGALHNVWCNANEHCHEDTIFGADLTWVDMVSGVPGLGEAMESVGWVQQTDNGIRFPKFNNHNTSAAERQKRYRDRKAGRLPVTDDVTRNVTRCARVAPKKREEESGEEQEDTAAQSSTSVDKTSNGRLTPEQFVKAWNLRSSEKRFPKVQKLTDARRAKLKSRLGQEGWFETFKSGLDHLPLGGDWQPDLDWMIANETNVYKLAEGKYDKWGRDGNGKTQKELLTPTGQPLPPSMAELRKAYEARDDDASC